MSEGGHVQVSSIADAVATAFMEGSRQPDYRLMDVKVVDGKMHWLTDIAVGRSAALGMGDRVPFEEWPEHTRHFYEWANRRRTCSELSFLVVTIVRELWEAGAEVFHGDLRVTGVCKVAGRTVQPIVEPYIHLVDGRSVIDMKHLRTGELSHCHSWVRVTLRPQVTSAPAEPPPRDVFLDVSYPQFPKNAKNKPYFLGEDCTLGGVCRLEHAVEELECEYSTDEYPYSVDMRAVVARVMQLLKR